MRRQYLIAIAVLVAATIVNAGIRFAPSGEAEKPLDLTALSNSEFMGALGEPVGSAKSCPFATGPLDSAWYFDEKADEDALRVVGVCTPRVPAGPPQ